MSFCGSYRAARASLREVMDEEAESRGGESRAILSQPRILTISRSSQGTWLFPAWTEEQVEDGSLAASVTQAPGWQGREGGRPGQTSLGSGPQPIPAAHGQNDQGRFLGPEPQVDLGTRVSHPWGTAASRTGLAAL